MRVEKRAAWSAAVAAAVLAMAGGPTARTTGPPVVKMGLNDSRSGAIARLGDATVYEFTITRPGVFTFAVRNIPDAVRLGPEIAELHLILTGPKDFEPWSAFTIKDRKHFKSAPFALPNGTYRLKIKDYFDDAASMESYTVQTEFSAVTDPGEPNNTPATATPLRNGQPTKGSILPRKDVDYYAIRLDTPGRLSITITDIPKAIREGRGLKGLSLGLLDQNGRVLREFTSGLRQDTLETGEMVRNVGTYYLCVRDFDNDNFSGSPYTIMARFPARKGTLSPDERDLLAATQAQFEKSGDGLDTEERALLKRLETRFMED